MGTKAVDEGFLVPEMEGGRIHRIQPAAPAPCDSVLHCHSREPIFVTRCHYDVPFLTAAHTWQRRTATSLVRASPMSVRKSVVVKADADDVMADLTSGAEDLADKLTTYWEESDNKPTLVAVGFGGLLALYFLSNLVNAVDRLPVVSNAFELVGIIFTGWTAYRWYLVEGEKEKLTADVKGFLSKVGVDL